MADKSLDDYLKINKKAIYVLDKSNRSLEYYINDLKAIKDKKNIQPANLENVYLLRYILVTSNQEV